jgi:hypothetical protein
MEHRAAPNNVIGHCPSDFNNSDYRGAMAVAKLIVMNRYSWSLNPIEANDLVFLE